MRGDVAMMKFLAAGVPLTLLLDIMQPPDADEVYVVEGGSADWLVAREARAV